MKKSSVSSVVIVIILIFAIAGIVNVCRDKYGDMVLEDTYISSSNKQVKIELTKENEELLDDYGNILFIKHIAYLHVDGETYKGYYSLFVSNKLKKELWVDFYTDSGSSISEYFFMKGNKLTLQDEFRMYRADIFEENQTFVKQTWWNIWGKKAAIFITILGTVWICFSNFKDSIKNKNHEETREE